MQVSMYRVILMYKLESFISVTWAISDLHLRQTIFIISELNYCNSWSFNSKRL